MSEYRNTLNGDGPCHDCAGENIVWFTDNVFWNAVAHPDQTSMDVILCVTCFVKRAEAAGFQPTSWRIIPQWPIRRVEK